MSALPLVLLHGWGSHAGVWAGVIAKLDLGHAVFAPDFPGDGGATGTMEEVVDELATIAPDRCVVAGWSMGGQLALMWARRHPQQVARLMLISATPRFINAADWPHGMAPEVFAGFFAALERDTAATLRRFLLLQAQGDAQSRTVARQLEAALALQAEPRSSVLMQTLRWLQTTDLRATLPQITQSALVVHGDRDRIAPPAAGEYLATQLPQARLALLAGAAHAPFISDPGAVGRLMTDFCNE